MARPPYHIRIKGDALIAIEIGSDPIKLSVTLQDGAGKTKAVALHYKGDVGANYATADELSGAGTIDGKIPADKMIKKKKLLKKTISAGGSSLEFVDPGPSKRPTRGASALAADPASGGGSQM